MKRKIVIVILVILLLVVVEVFILVRVNENTQEPAVIEEPVPDAGPHDPVEGVLLDKTTNDETKYRLEVLRYDEIENGSLKKWMDNSLASSATDGEDPVYYALYNNGSANLDIYLFMPAANLLMGDVILSSIRVTEANNTLFFYIETDDDTTHEKQSKDLILHIRSTSDTTKARTERLIINGVTYSCANTTFTDLT